MVYYGLNVNQLVYAYFLSHKIRDLWSFKGKSLVLDHCVEREVSTVFLLVFTIRPVEHHHLSSTSVVAGWFISVLMNFALNSGGLLKHKRPF